MRPAVVHLLGFPGTGKRTVAEALAARAAADGHRLVVVDNHLTSNPFLVALDIGPTETVPPEVWDRVADARDLVDAAIRDLAPSGVSHAFTNVIVDELSSRSIDRCRTLGAARGGVYVPVVLHCDGPERARRVPRPDRAARHKWTDPAGVADFVDRHTLVRPDSAILLDLDVTTTPPKDPLRRGAVRSSSPLGSGPWPTT